MRLSLVSDAKDTDNFISVCRYLIPKNKLDAYIDLDCGFLCEKAVFYDKTRLLSIIFEMLELDEGSLFNDALYEWTMKLAVWNLKYFYKCIWALKTGGLLSASNINLLRNLEPRLGALSECMEHLQHNHDQTMVYSSVVKVLLDPQTSMLKIKRIADVARAPGDDLFRNRSREEKLVIWDVLLAADLAKHLDYILIMLLGIKQLTITFNQEEGVMEPEYVIEKLLEHPNLELLANVLFYSFQVEGGVKFGEYRQEQEQKLRELLLLSKIDLMSLNTQIGPTQVKPKQASSCSASLSYC